MNILWLARQVPFPMLSGDRVYTGKLVQSIARAGASIVYVGFVADALENAGLPPEIDWRIVPGRLAPRTSFLRSVTLPMVAIRHRTRAYRAVVRRMLDERDWDVVVLDQYAMVAWLDEVERSRFAGVLAHVAHDFESRVTLDLVRNFSGNPLTKLVLFDNSRRTGLAERRLARGCDLVTAITDEDQLQFRRIGSAKAYATLKPGYDGHRVERRALGSHVPRCAVIVGSFDWLPKRLNLIRFVKAADRLFAENDIQLRIIGTVPDDLREEILSFARSVRIFGFVDDLAKELAEARAALVVEETGGGFKLKMLDYIFHRVPLFGLSHALTGLPDSMRNCVCTAETMETLVQEVVSNIDAIRRLNEMQDGAYAACRTIFDWSETARAFFDGIHEAQAARRMLAGSAKRIGGTELAGTAVH